MSWEPEENGDSEGDRASLITATRQYAHYATAGIMFPVSIALGSGVGYFLDQRAGTTPLLALLGMALGITAAIRNLLRVAARDEDV